MRVDSNYMPVVGEEGHVLFDTDRISPLRRTAFLQDPLRFVYESGKTKTLGVHTNALTGGCMPEGCAKEIEAVRLVAPEADVPKGTRVALLLSAATTRLIETSLVVNEWLSIRTIDVPQQNDAGVIVPGPSRPLLFSSLESFRFEVGEAPPCDEARLEVRGTLWRPDYASELYKTWRANEVLRFARNPGIRPTTTDAAGAGMFDTERLIDGSARTFADSRVFVDGALKKYGEDSNLIGPGGMVPRTHMACVQAIRVESLGQKVHGPLGVRLVVNGVEQIRAVLDPAPGVHDQRTLVLREPFFLLNNEHFTLDVYSPECAGGLIKATLVGPYYTSFSG